MEKTGNERFKICVLGYFNDILTTYTIKSGFIKVSVVSTGGDYGQLDYLLYVANSANTQGTQLKMVIDSRNNSAGTFYLKIDKNNNICALYLLCEGYDTHDSIGAQITCSLPSCFRLYSDRDLTTLCNKERTLTWSYSSHA